MANEIMPGIRKSLVFQIIHDNIIRLCRFYWHTAESSVKQ